MTAVGEQAVVRPRSRIGGIVVVIVGAVVALLLIGLRTYRTFPGGGADMAHHYALVYWFSHHWTLPSAHNPSLLEMARYPPGAQFLAASVGRVVGSPFRGMQLVALAAVVLIWCAIGALLTTLPGRRRWVALTALAAVLALDTAAGPLRLDVHGFEIVENFFFSQVVGQAVVWWLVWLMVRRSAGGWSTISTAWPLAIAALLATEIHVLPAVELLVLVGCLCAAEALARWRADRRSAGSLAAPILLPGATALGVVLSPGFREMRTLSANDGALDVPYLNGLASYLAVAAAVIVVSLALLVWSSRRRREVGTAAVLQGLAFAGIAVAVPCVAQAVLLAGGEGSAYAVKKYVFGLLTVLVVDACAAVALVVPDAAVDVQPRPAWRFLAAAALAVVAIMAAFSHHAGYSMTRVVDLEQEVTAATHAWPASANGHRYAVQLPSSDPVLDYMFSISIVGARRDRVAYAIIRGGGLPFHLTSRQLLTAQGSRYDSSACRRHGPIAGIVAVDANCWWGTSTKCAAVNVLGEAGLVIDGRLHGFSLAERDGRWTNGQKASFSCTLAPRRRERALKIAVYATAFLPAGVPHQRVTLAVGDERKRFVFTLQAPAAVLRLTAPPPANRRLTLTFALPDAVSPRDAGYNSDARRLAIFVNQIRIG